MVLKLTILAAHVKFRLKRACRLLFGVRPLLAAVIRHLYERLFPSRQVATVSQTSTPARQVGVPPQQLHQGLRGVQEPERFLLAFHL